MPSGRAVPWATIIFLTAILFLIEHNLQASLTSTSTTSVWAEEAIRGIQSGSLERRVGYAIFGLWGLFTIFLRRQRYQLASSMTGYLILAFAVWSFLSLGWAADFRLTLRRLGTTVLVGVGVVGFLRRSNIQQATLVITLVSLALLAIGLGAEIAYGSFRPWSPGYRFAGTLHPNVQGYNLGFLFLGAVCLARGRWRAVFLSIAVVAVVFLLLTKSRTATGGALIATFCYAVLRTRPTVFLAGFLGLATVGLIYVFLVTNGLVGVPWEILLMGRGVDPEGFTLSGRIPLWEYLWGYVERRPLVGFGYNSFMSASHAADVALVVAFGINSAHSTYLDVLLGLGAIGLGLFLAVWIGAIARAATLSSRFREPTYAFLGSIAILMLTDGLLDSSPIFPAPQVWTALVLGYLGFRDPVREGQASF